METLRILLQGRESELQHRESVHVENKALREEFAFGVAQANLASTEDGHRHNFVNAS